MGSALVAPVSRLVTFVVSHAPGRWGSSAKSLAGRIGRGGVTAGRYANTGRCHSCCWEPPQHQCASVRSHVGFGNTDQVSPAPRGSSRPPAAWAMSTTVGVLDGGQFSGTSSPPRSATPMPSGGSAIFWNRRPARTRGQNCGGTGGVQTGPSWTPGRRPLSERPQVTGRRGHAQARAPDRLQFLDARRADAAHRRREDRLADERAYVERAAGASPWRVAGTRSPQSRPACGVQTTDAPSPTGRLGWPAPHPRRQD